MRTKRIKMNFINILSVILLLITFAVLAVAVYALFSTYSQGRSLDFGTENTDKLTYISSEYQLRQYAYDRNDNPDSEVSYITDAEENKGQRENIVFTADITLSYDLIVNRDVNIDLNGYTLDLNGYKLLFEHAYRGTFYLRDSGDGGVINGNEERDGRIIFLLPRAVFVNEWTIADNVSVINAFDGGAAADGYESLVADRIFELAKIEGIYLGGLDRGEYNPAADELYPAYVPLMRRYYDTGITFSWSSSAENIVTADGVITPSAGILKDGEDAVTLTLGVVINGLSYHKAYNITIPHESNDRISYGEDEILSLFEDCIIIDGVIYVNNDIKLPERNVYFYLDYSYEIINVEPAPQVGDPDDIVNYILKKNDKTRTVDLKVTINNHAAVENTAEMTLKIRIISESNINLANSFIAGLSAYIMTSRESVITLPTAEEFANYGIIYDEDIFSLVVENCPPDGEGNSYPYYYIAEDTDGLLKIFMHPETTLPETGYVAYVVMNLKFATGQPAEIEKRVPVYFIDSSGGEGGEGMDRYAAIYEYLNGRVNSETDIRGMTYITFNMPRRYLEVGIEYYLESYAELFDNGGLTIISDGNNVTFMIDPSKVPVADTPVIVRYRFEGMEAGKTYDRYSAFIIPGIINNRADGIPDAVLYRAILEAYDADADGVLTVYEAGEYKEIFDLSEYATRTERLTVADFKGIEFLTSTEKIILDDNQFFSGAYRNANMNYLAELRQLTRISLRNTGLSNAYLGYFMEFMELTELDISDNAGVTDLSALKINNTVKIFRAARCMITQINDVSPLAQVEILDISNNTASVLNRIELFTSLLDMGALQKVYLYNTGYTDVNYGASGRYNISTFTVLTNRKVEVYNGYENDQPKLFVIQPEMQELVWVLESIIYSSNAKVPITLPGRIYIGQTASYYEITYTTNLPGASVSGNGTATVTVTPSGSTPAGTYQIIASVTKNGVTAYRVLTVKA